MPATNLSPVKNLASCLKVVNDESTPSSVWYIGLFAGSFANNLLYALVRLFLCKVKVFKVSLSGLTIDFISTSLTIYSSHAFITFEVSSGIGFFPVKTSPLIPLKAWSNPIFQLSVSALVLRSKATWCALC